MTEFLSNDPRELRAELAKVRRQLVKVEQSRFTPIHPKETVHNIFLGKRFSLELYKSLQVKVLLLYYLCVRNGMTNSSKRTRST